MQIKIFSIPLLDNDGQMEEFNHFLRANKIIDIQKNIAVHNGNSIWSFCVTYMPTANGASQNYDGNKRNGGSKAREDLSPLEQLRFEELRKVRRATSDELGLPAYMIFTDQELAQICKLSQPSEELIKGNQGIAKKHSEAYAMIFKNIDFDKIVLNEANKQFGATDSESGQSVSGFQQGLQGKAVES